MNTTQDYIGVFDSGVGGISVLRELVKQMPGERFLYFGDSANAPYGEKTTEEVRLLALHAAERLMERGLKALVIACNTATAAAVDLLRQTYPDMIIVGIEPALKPAADRFPRGSIGVMATAVTLREQKLAHLEQSLPDIRLHRIPAPGLVELVEAGQAESPECLELMHRVLDPYRGKLDALVLGCTHYPFAKKAISAVLGPETELLDGGPGTARQTLHRLQEKKLLFCGQGEIKIENSLEDPAILALSARLLSEEANP